MSNDDFGIIDDSGDGQQQAIPQDDSAVEKENAAKHLDAKAFGSADERKEALEEIKRDILAMSSAEQEEIIGALALRIESEQVWSGLLPDPESFAAYPKEVQQKMVEWNDVTILGESKRNDKLIDSFTKDRKISQVGNFLINVLFLAAAFVSFIMTNDPASFGFLSVPGFTIAVNVIRERRDSK